MPATIRPGRPADLHAIAEIQSVSPEAAAWRPADYLQYCLWVAEAEGKVVGFLATRVLVEGEAEVLNLAVVPRMRRQGIARDLLKACFQTFSGDLFLEVRMSNVTAQKFYKSLGFQELTWRPDYYDNPPEPAIVMKFHSC